MMFIAVRQLLARKRQTILVLLGISLGTMMFLVIAGVQKGVQNYILEQLLNNTAHIRIDAHEEKIDAGDLSERMFGPDSMVRWLVEPSGRRDEKYIEYPQGWFDRLASDSRVLGFTPGIYLNVLASRGPNQIPAQFFGIEAENYVRMTRMESYMKEGSLHDLKSGGGKIVIGAGLMERLGAGTGDTLRIALGEGRVVPFKVGGWFKMGIKEVDDQLIFVSLQDAQRISHSPGRIGLISVYLVDPTQSQALAKEWSILSRDRVVSWEEASGNFQQVFTIQRFSRLIITFAILIVAGFGTYNVLSILVHQKRREIAILRSIGYPPQSVLQLFLIQGLILGVGGAIVGMLLGHLSNLYISAIELGFDTGMGNKLPVSFEPMNYLAGLGLALLSAIVASYLPARAASRMTPIDIIRSEA